VKKRGKREKDENIVWRQGHFSSKYNYSTNNKCLPNYEETKQKDQAY
jgi:hypothetical protein